MIEVCDEHHTRSEAIYPRRGGFLTWQFHRHIVGQSQPCEWRAAVALRSGSWPWRNLSLSEKGAIEAGVYDVEIVDINEGSLLELVSLGISETHGVRFKINIDLQSKTEER